MNIRPEEISNVIKEQIRNYTSKIEMKETGTVILVGDGIARVYGLRECMASELLEFEDGSFGMAQNLETEAAPFSFYVGRFTLAFSVFIRMPEVS